MRKAKQVAYLKMHVQRSKTKQASKGEGVRSIVEDPFCIREKSPSIHYLVVKPGKLMMTSALSLGR